MPSPRRALLCLVLVLLSTACSTTSTTQKRPIVGLTSTEVLQAVRTPLTDATRIVVERGRDSTLSVTRDPSGGVRIDTNIAPGHGVGVFKQHPVGSFVILDQDTFWREHTALALHSLPIDAWVRLPSRALALRDDRPDVSSSIAHLLTDAVLSDVDIDSLLLVEIEAASSLSAITAAPLGSTPRPERFHFANDTHELTATIDEQRRLTALSLQRLDHTVVVRVSYEPQQFVSAPSFVLDDRAATPLIDDLTVTQRLEALVKAALRFDATTRLVARRMNPLAPSARSIDVLTEALEVSDSLSGVELLVPSANTPAKVWSNTAVSHSALRSANQSPTFVQLQQRDISVCLRLSSNGSTFTFASPTEDLTTRLRGSLSASTLARDPYGSVISSVSLNDPACNFAKAEPRARR